MALSPTFQFIKMSVLFRVSLLSLLPWSPQGRYCHPHMPEITKLLLPLLQMSHTLMFWDIELSPVSATFSIALGFGRKGLCPLFTRLQTKAHLLKVSSQHS